MSEEFKYVVRLAETDLDGTRNVVEALARICGIGWNTAVAVCRIVGIDTRRRLGELSDAELRKVEEVIRKLHEYVPGWFCNRPKDPRTGKDVHLVGSDLVLAVRADVELLKKIKCWRGIRHSLGLKVRGQRTRTTGRTGVTIGVTKKPKK
ncbi:MAG: 30S ribosomal protein S13 [Thermoprotei archaeon]|nr:MAG: 30S ribosomal protein S13 [Thermoprotei archaeon]RLF24289.1 MAG: 30S ribosomal protein S13 [Thermoprotei archaeon]